MSAETREPLPDLPERSAAAHKGTFGTVIVIGGSATMLGAPAIAARAALRIGCGLARIATAEAMVPHCLTIEPSATGLVAPADADAWPLWVHEHVDDKTVVAVGPGLGSDPGAAQLLTALAAQSQPVVCDADGLNALAKMGPQRLLPQGPWILTPHPGEYGRLAEAADVDADPIDPVQRPQAAQALARATGTTVVLKGQQTVIADLDHWALNTTGGPALATAGSGDVLTGTIAGLIAQGMTPFDGARLGCHLHGAAGDIWSERHGPAGLVARELSDVLPEASRRHRE